MSIEDDHASDRRFALALGGVLVVEVILAGLADAGAIPLWLWLVLAIVAILVAGLITAVSQSRAEGTPLVGRRHRRQADGS